MLVTVVELPDFTRRAKAVLSETERVALIDHLAANPEAGIPLGGGLRKLRFAREGAGKSGGVRSIHYCQTGAGPLYLLTVFAKNEKANLSSAELLALYRLGAELDAIHGRRQ
ncbi:type II toxin-antitoxin system RelE/ParE family toxin [Tabrizicola sp. M-4]|uniref:type II toxin-antitoxin system RelE/ParE family toxin n=1 Tax=Tabrizicola sp. M-4 TaxID=3055847 RepID=UPI003DA90A50